MKIDLYRKVVLTVIAVCLCVIAFRSTPAARPSRDITDVNIVQSAGRPVYLAPLPVKITKQGGGLMDRATWEFINSFAPWLAALGMIGAVIVSLYLARRDKKIRFEVRAGIRLVPTPGERTIPEYLLIQVTNIGYREAELRSVEWRIGLFKKQHVFQVTARDDGMSSDIPIRLRDGEMALYFIPIGRTTFIDDFAKDFLMKHPKIRSRYINICAITSVGSEFEEKIEKNLRKELIKRAIELKASEKTSKK